MTTTTKLVPRIIRDGVIDEMLISIAILKKNMAREPLLLKDEPDIISRMEDAIDEIKSLRVRLITLEDSISALPPSASSELESLRSQARDLRGRAFTIYEDVMGG